MYRMSTPSAEALLKLGVINDSPIGLLVPTFWPGPQLTSINKNPIVIIIRFTNPPSQEINLEVKPVHVLEGIVYLPQ